jgi:glycosyltransferase involved in cell wall biosynthesis
VGRLSADKGVHLLLEAWARAGRPFEQLTLVGDGPAGAAVREAEGQTGSRVTGLGRLDASGVADAVRSAAAVVVPSTAPEAMPLVILEAFSHGRPVIATGRRALQTVVTPSVGWLAEPTVVDLARALSAAARDDVAGKGTAARSLYERTYSPSVVMAAQREIYRAVIDETRDTRPGDEGTGPRG